MPPIIRRATVEDAAAFARCMGDARVFPSLMQLPYADEGLWRQRLADITAPGKPDLLFVAEREDEGGKSVVGSAGLHPLSALPRQRHVAMLGISVLPEAWRQGIGSALMQAIVDCADRWMQFRRLHLDVYTDNAAAIALYRRFGFEVETTARAYALRDGAYVESHGMGRLNPLAGKVADGAQEQGRAATPAPAARPGTASGSWMLRAAEASDLDAVAALAMRRSVVECLAFAPLGAVEPVRERLAKPAPDCSLVALAEGHVIGYAALVARSPLRRRHAAACTIFVAPEWQRHGVGSALAAALLDWADRWAGLLRVELEVQQGDDAALALARRHDFEPEGVQRAAMLRDGAFVDVQLLARVRALPPHRPSAAPT